MSQEHAEVVRRWFDEVWNQRRAETIDELLHDDSICLTDDGPIRGPHEFRERMFAPFIAAFPDLQVVVEEMLAEGDHVVVRWRAEGTHCGDALGFPACNATAAFRGLTWLRVQDGRLTEGWQHSNIPQVVAQLAATTPQ